MLVPEATMYQNYSAIFGKHDIGSSREVLPVNAKSVSHPVDERADNHLGLGVGCSDVAHVPASSFGCNLICHSATTTSPV